MAAPFTTQNYFFVPIECELEIFLPHWWSIKGSERIDGPHGNANGGPGFGHRLSATKVVEGNCDFFCLFFTFGDTLPMFLVYYELRAGSKVLARVVKNYTSFSTGRELLVKCSKRDILELLRPYVVNHVVKFTFAATRTFVRPKPVANEIEIPKATNFTVFFDGEPFGDSKNADFRITCAGETCRCHKLVLAQRSPVFERMLSNAETAESKTGIADMSTYEVKDVKTLLNVIYGEKCALSEIKTESEMQDLFILLHLYQIQPELEVAGKLLTNMSKVTEDNVAKLMTFAERYELQGLQKKCAKALPMLPVNVIHSEEWTGQFERNAEKAVSFYKEILAQLMLEDKK